MDVRGKCQSHLWLLTGTGEGPVFTESLLKEGWRITVSVVSERASIPYKKFSLEKILVGPLNSEKDIRNVILNARNNQNEFHCVIDLTHPFAKRITPVLLKVCKELHQPFIRYERELEQISNAFLIENLSDLSNYDLNDKAILFALGVSKLEEAINVAKNLGAKVYARTLDNPDSIKKALSSSIQEENLAVLNPKFSNDGEIEKALVRKWKIDGIVCRQSGGVTEKLWNQVCSNMDINLWLISRPPANKLFESIDTYEKLCKSLNFINLK